MTSWVLWRGTERTRRSSTAVPNRPHERYDARSMTRRFCQIAAIVCLLFCGATLALLVRSDIVADGMAWPASKKCFLLALTTKGSCVIWTESSNSFHRRGFVHATPVDRRDIMVMEYDFVGLGLSLGQYYHPFLGTAYHVYGVCAPLWFIALLWLLFAFLFFRKSRRRLKAGHGFPALPAKPKCL